MDKYDDNRIKELLLKPETQRRGFEMLVRQYSEQLYWQVRRIVLTHEDSNDVLQNAFLKAWNALSSFHGDSKVFRASPSMRVWTSSADRRTFLWSVPTIRNRQWPTH